MQSIHVALLIAVSLPLICGGCGTDASQRPAASQASAERSQNVGNLPGPQQLLSDSALFQINGTVVDTSSSTVLPAGSTADVRIEIPDIRRDTLSPTLIVGLFFQMPDGTWAAGNTVAVRDLPVTAAGLTIVTELPVLNQPGKWTLAAMTEQQQPICLLPVQVN